MHVERIYTCPTAGGRQVEQQRVHVVAGAGIEGDRYFGRHDEPGQNLTLIEIEVVEAFVREHGREADLSITHRNLLTRGVRLNELVGATFRVGDVQLRGVELCEPCMGMGGALASETLSAAGVVKWFVHRGGLRVDVLSSGDIQCGAALTVAPGP